MKFKPYLLFLCILALLLSSCDDFTGGYGVGSDFKQFWTVDMTDETYYQIDASRLFIGEKCEIWCEDGWNIPSDMIEDLANTYDKTIYPKMINAFSSGEPFLDGGKPVANNPMEWADYLSGGNGKLTILLLDIEDGFSGNGGYVAGYFTPLNFFDDDVSNQCAMIYIDIYPGLNDVDNAKGTLAHEMQHLMNFIISVDKRAEYNAKGEITELYLMDTWIDEGLATSSEYIWTGKQVQDRIDWYNGSGSGGSRKPNGSIEWGNNFYVWDNRGDEDPDSILDDYATTYIFFQWLRIQSSSGMGIYKDIINSTDSDYNAVVNAARKSIDNTYTTGSNGWRFILRDWLAANFINAPSGRYGYKGDSALKDLTPWFHYSEESEYKYYSYDLFPGEGISSYTEYPPIVEDSSKIKYAGMEDDPSAVVTDLSVTGTTKTGYNWLLTYNIDTNTEGNSTEAKIPLSISIPKQSPGERSILGSPPDHIKPKGSINFDSSGIVSQPRKPFVRPYPISARDRLRRNGYDEDYSGKTLLGLQKSREIPSDE